MLTETRDEIAVSFVRGPERLFDALIIAEGINSRTRTLVYDDEPVIRRLGLYASYFTIDRCPHDDDWARWYNTTQGRPALLRPDNKGHTRASPLFPLRAGRVRRPARGAAKGSHKEPLC